MSECLQSYAALKQFPTPVSTHRHTHSRSDQVWSGCEWTCPWHEGEYVNLSSTIVDHPPVKQHTPQPVAQVVDAVLNCLQFKMEKPINITDYSWEKGVFKMWPKTRPETSRLLFTPCKCQPSFFKRQTKQTSPLCSCWKANTFLHVALLKCSLWVAHTWLDHKKWNKMPLPLTEP